MIVVLELTIIVGILQKMLSVPYTISVQVHSRIEHNQSYNGQSQFLHLFLQHLSFINVGQSVESIHQGRPGNV